MDPGKRASGEQLLEPSGCSLTRPGRSGLQQGRAGHPALPPHCFILATDCTNPRANIELAWILNSSCKHHCSQPLALCSLSEEGIQVRLAPGTAWANNRGQGGQSVPQEPECESSDLPLRSEDVPLGWKWPEGPLSTEGQRSPSGWGTLSSPHRPPSQAAAKAFVLPVPPPRGQGLETSPQGMPSRPHPCLGFQAWATVPGV